MVGVKIGNRQESTKKPPRLVGGFSEKNWIKVFVRTVKEPGCDN